MIVSKIHSGLGNQMFHYATGYALAKRAGLPFRLDTTWFGRRVCHLREWSIATPEASVPTMLPQVQEYRNPFFQPLAPEPCYLAGHWQSERYFADARDDLLRLFVPRGRFSIHPAAVAIHARLKTRMTGRSSGIATKEYYTAAIDAFRRELPGPTFAVWTDDPQVAADLFPADVTIHPTGHPVDDLYAMSQCDHQIIANSSYSWWSAWLNQNPDKRIIWPDMLAANIPPVAETDYIPASWKQP